MAGHVSKRMLKHYSHIRTQAKWRGVDSLVAPVKVEVKTAEISTLSVSLLRNPLRWAFLTDRNSL